jgi:hypothetical protein
MDERLREAPFRGAFLIVPQGLDTSTFVTIQQHFVSTEGQPQFAARFVHFPPQTRRSDTHGLGAKPTESALSSKMGQSSTVQNMRFAVEADFASSSPESAFRSVNFGPEASIQSNISVAVERVSTVLRCELGDVHAGLATISGYVEKCGERPSGSATDVMENAQSVAGFNAALMGAHRNGSLRETWAGRTAVASSREASAGLRAFRGYIRVSGSAVGFTVAGSDGAKEIDCHV